MDAHTFGPSLVLRPLVHGHFDSVSISVTKSQYEEYRIMNF